MMGQNEKGRYYLTCLITGNIHICPACRKAIRTEEAMRLTVFSHEKCSDESYAILATAYAHKSTSEQLSLFPDIVPSRHNNWITKVQKSKRLKKKPIDKDEFAEFLRARENGEL